jgi:small-conductance mechanosensitive channel
MVCDVLGIDINMRLQSVFAAGGVGALIFSLASKDLAEQIVGGFAISAWDAFDVGDDIRLGDGTEGTVKRIGLVETEIQGYDNIVIKIPNSQLFNQRVSNLSRIERSRVLQKLRFKYSDLSKLDAVLQDITDEIKKSCPKAITDGSKPLSALLAQYEPDHVEVVVNSHFNIPPGSAEYFTNRQEVLLAIARAVQKNGIEFALPSITSYQSDNDDSS